MAEKKRKTKSDEQINDEIEIVDIDDHSNAKIKQLQDKLKQCETERMAQLEDLQRAKAEFLNSKKRIEEDRLRDRERAVIAHIDKLLPLYDSFHMAMSNKEHWERVDPVWRKGIESILNQLQTVLSSYDVTSIDEQNVPFDPEIHEAIDYAAVESEELHDMVTSVVQAGFVRNKEDRKELIRPARVIIGRYEE